MSWTALEPARVRAIGAALILLLGALGITVTYDLPNIVEAIALLTAVIVPLLQGETTRAVVTPVAKTDPPA